MICRKVEKLKGENIFSSKKSLLLLNRRGYIHWRDWVLTFGLSFRQKKGIKLFVIHYFKISYIVVPILLPISAVIGIDPLWFAILIAMNLQTSFLTPSFGFSLFYLKKSLSFGGADGGYFQRSNTLYFNSDYCADIYSTVSRIVRF